MQPRDKTTHRVKKKPFNISTVSLHKKAYDTGSDSQ